jgi:DNA repair protein RadD
MLADCDEPGNSLVVLPTGAGKSIVIAEFANRRNEEILILQPSKEILDQNARKLLQYIHPMELGVYSASFNRKDVRKYTFATIQSIYLYPEKFDHIGVVIIDEAHTMNPKKFDSMFTSFITAINRAREVQGLHPIKVFGLTATPYRNMQCSGKDGMVGRGLKILVRLTPRFWNRIIYNINPGQLTGAGYLAPLTYHDRSLVDQKDLPLNRARTDFDGEKVSKHMLKHEPVMIDKCIKARDYFKSTLVFCSSVSQAHRMSQAVPGSEAVDGKTPDKLRDAIIERFRDGETKIVFNVGVLTTGFDHPALDCIVLIRPTKSLILYYQMLGRGVRTAEGKARCAVMDFTGTCKTMGTIESIRMSKNHKNLWELWNENPNGDMVQWHNKVSYTYNVQTKKPIFGGRDFLVGMR